MSLSRTAARRALAGCGFLYQWADRVTSHFPQLPRATAFTLALWAYGMALAHACALTAVALHLAPLLGQAVNTLRQRLSRIERLSGLDLEREDWLSLAIAVKVVKLRLMRRSAREALSFAVSAIFGVLNRTAEAGSREILLVGAQDEIVTPSRIFTAERL